MDRSRAALAQTAVAAACGTIVNSGLYNPSCGFDQDNTNIWRAEGARSFKHKKKRRQLANKSRKMNRRH